MSVVGLTVGSAASFIKQGKVKGRSDKVTASAEKHQWRCCLSLTVVTVSSSVVT